MYQREHDYKFVTYVGTVPVQPQPLTARFELMENELYQRVNVGFKEFVEANAGDFVVSNSTFGHLERSIMKIDAPVCHKFREYPAVVAKALGSVGRMYDEAFRARDMTDLELQDETIMDRGSGVIPAYMGLPKKGDCFRANLHNTVFKAPKYHLPVLWKVAGKRETRTRHDYVVLGKQRTFIIESSEHLWNTKKAYGLQNKGLFMSGWSCYGHNPYSGGVDRLARRLLKHKRFWMLDGRGWDRLLPCMVEVYILRNKYKVLDHHLKWVFENLINSYLVLPNGDVVFKTWGNNSGSGNTTGDNVIAMTFVLMYLFHWMGYSEKEILANVEVAIFGDDVVGSDSLPCSDDELQYAFESVFTGLFGIVLDPFVISRELSEMQFLGYMFSEHDGRWIPKYPLSKLCASVKGNMDSMDFRAELAKLSSLALMSAGHGRTVFNFFRDALKDAVYGSNDPFALKLQGHNLDIFIPTYEDILSWYLGYEGDLALFYLLNLS